MDREAGNSLAPVPPQALKKRLARVVGIGVLGATVALLASFAIRSNSHTVSVVAFFVKFAYSVGLMAMLIVALEQIARPGGGLMVRYASSARYSPSW
ncbi:DUF1109 family protein (plasmid) [Rhizobium sp. CCGE532]|nr:DUF1109 family protein [Rhizobium sp. CCGE532]